MIEVERVPLDAIAGMREAYRREMACQIVHDSWHARGFTQSYLLRMDGEVAGYGSVGGALRDPKDTVKEFYVVPERRGSALHLFRSLVAASRARTVEAQTNDRLLFLMMLDCAADLSSDRVVFDDGLTTTFAHAGVTFRATTDADRETMFEHTHEPVGEYVLEKDGRVAGTGGLAFHYNHPYADLYMEIDASHRRKGLGAFLIQELKRVCYELGFVPCARCNVTNEASRRTLQRAGMFPCARIVRGVLT